MHKLPELTACPRQQLICEPSSMVVFDNKVLLDFSKCMTATALASAEESHLPTVHTT